MRLYTLCNFYLSAIQQGVQTAHVTSELFAKYRQDSLARRKLYEWAEEHKTIIILNGGAAGNIREAALQLQAIGKVLNLPTAWFHEDEFSLDGTMTCTGIVVPEKIYDAKATFNGVEDVYVGLNVVESTLAMALRSKGLAR